MSYYHHQNSLEVLKGSQTVLLSSLKIKKSLRFYSLQYVYKRKTKENTMETLTTYTETAQGALKALHTNKEAIKALKADNQQLLAVALKSIGGLIKELKASHSNFSSLSKAKLANIVKLHLDTKDIAINVACELYILGLNIDNTLSIAMIKDVIKAVKDDDYTSLTKSKVNKADKEKLTEYVREYRKYLKALKEA